MDRREENAAVRARHYEENAAVRARHYVDVDGNQISHSKGRVLLELNAGEPGFRGWLEDNV
jgi:hypothetical protein